MKIITDINEDEINFFKKQYLNAVDVQTQLEDLLNNKPDGRKKALIKEWKEKTNFLVDLYNTKAGFAAYKKVK